MYKSISLFAGLTALLAMGSAQAAVCPAGVTFVNYAINDDTGHTYEIYRKDGISWEEADACARRPLGNAPGAIVGHLATVTSSSENAWVIDDLLQPARVKPAPNLGQSQVWVGGFRDAGAWRWVNNEGQFGPFPPGVTGPTVYTNWASGEPNNQGGSENHLTLGRFPSNLYGWNDEGSAVGTIGGFIVEYDTPRLIGECGGTTTRACTTIEGQTLTFPAGSFEAGDSVSFTAFEFTDPRIDPATGKCSVNRGPLPLFTDTTAFGHNAALTIPEYLCGSPKFLVADRAVAAAGTTGLRIVRAGGVIRAGTLAHLLQ